MFDPDTYKALEFVFTLGALTTAAGLIIRGYCAVDNAQTSIDLAYQKEFDELRDKCLIGTDPEEIVDMYLHSQELIFDDETRVEALEAFQSRLGSELVTIIKGEVADSLKDVKSLDDFGILEDFSPTYERLFR